MDDGREFVREVLPQHWDAEPLQRLVAILGKFHGLAPHGLVEHFLFHRESALLPPPLRRLDRLPSEQNLLPQYVKVRLVRGEREHDKIGIQSVQDVDQIGIVPLLGALGAHVRHDLVLPLSGHGGVAEYHLEIPPRRIRGEALADVKSDVFGEVDHEFRTGGDDVRIPRHVGRGGDARALLGEAVAHLHLRRGALLRLLRRAESPRALLVHLRAGGDAVDGEVQELSGTDRTDESVHVQTYVFVHLLLVFGLGAVLGMRAGVDDPVHVDV
mmetsp:Transcript_6747/g.16597  ORF Transcript_6747/g.16597 Transcript_6747/m.16597 type:complete len:270 (+) Transcript_6747:3036-3845(+)